MILWDRIVRNLNSGSEAVMRLAISLSERTRLESKVARMLVRKGKLESRIDKLNQKLGDRVSRMYEQKSDDIINDLEVQDILKDVMGLREEVEELSIEIRKASVGEDLEDEG